MSTVNRLIANAKEMTHIRHSGTIGHLTFIRNFFMGAGLAYAIAEEKYWHIPFIIVWASPYAGYQTYKNSDRIADYMKRQCPATKHTRPQLPSLFVLPQQKLVSRSDELA